jgi:hypothetical protein
MLPLTSLSIVPSGTSAVLDMTADFAPLLKMGLTAGLCILIFAVVTAVYDTPGGNPGKPRTRQTAQHRSQISPKPLRQFRSPG